MTTCESFKEMRLADRHGEVLGGRDLGKRIRLHAVRQVESGEDVVIDLDGVLTVTPSFADELFGKLPAETGGHVEFVNVSEHLQNVADMARAGRPPNGSGGAG
jgi:hypothetical protein